MANPAKVSRMRTGVSRAVGKSLPSPNAMDPNRLLKQNLNYQYLGFFSFRMVILRLMSSRLRLLNTPPTT